MHGLFLIIEKKIPLVLNRLIAIPMVFILTTLLWIPFRAENTTHLLAILKSMMVFKDSFQSFIFEVQSVFTINKLIWLASIFIFFMVLRYKIGVTSFGIWISSQNQIVRWGFYFFLFILILLVGNYNVKPNFIYFQF